jgi:hypothetical protein
MALLVVEMLNSILMLHDLADDHEMRVVVCYDPRNSKPTQEIPKFHLSTTPNPHVISAEDPLRITYTAPNSASWAASQGSPPRSLRHRAVPCRPWLDR